MMNKNIKRRRQAQRLQVLKSDAKHCTFSDGENAVYLLRLIKEIRSKQCFTSRELRCLSCGTQCLKTNWDYSRMSGFVCLCHCSSVTRKAWQIKCRRKTTKGFVSFASSRLHLTPFMPAFRNKTNTKAGFPKVYQRNCWEKLEKIVNSVLHFFVFLAGEKKISTFLFVNWSVQREKHTAAPQHPPPPTHHP